MDEHGSADTIARVKRWLRRYVRRRRVQQGAGITHLYNLASESEMLQAIGLQAAEAPSPLEAAFDTLDTKLEDATSELQTDEGSNPAKLLSLRLDLPQVAEDLLLLVVAPQLSPALLRVYRLLAQDALARHPSASFLIDLSESIGHPPAAVTPWLGPDSPLIRLGLLAVLSDDAALTDPPPTSARVAGTGRLHAWFCGDDGCHDAPPGVTIHPCPALPSLVVDPTIAAELRTHVRWLTEPRAPARRLLVHGPEGAGRRTLLALLADGIVTLDVPRITHTATAIDHALRIARREARLRGQLLVIVGLDAPATTPAVARALLAELSREPGPVCLVSERQLSHEQLSQVGPPGVAVMHWECHAPERALQLALWHSQLGALADTIDVEELVGRYHLVPAKICAAASEARLDHASGRPVNHATLVDAIRRQLSHRLGDLATRVETAFARDALITGPKIDEKIDEILSFYRNRDALFNRWCFDEKMPYGRGLSCLFAGPPGTGKTMAAAVIARELGLEVFKVDLSRVVDKYIGETDKQVARLFDEGARSQAVLLFDEADSLFAQRTEVRNSTDRYANLTVNFLLQRLEAYSGISILTTNLEASFDDAFKRRIRFRIHFDRPDFEERRRLWLRALPPRSLCAADIDIDELADCYELVGADILNASLQASAMAQRQRSRLSRIHLIASIEAILSGRGVLVRSQL